MSLATSSPGAHTPNRPHSSFGLSAPTRRDAISGLGRLWENASVLTDFLAQRTRVGTRWIALFV
jgi:hypothetical protein